MNQEIINKVQIEYDKLIQEYGENRLLWAAAVGPAIYSHDSSNDIAVAACYLPIEDELYNITSNQNKNTIDIRYLASLINNSDINTMELFLSSYKIINPLYKDILNTKLFINKELLFLTGNDDLINILKHNIKEIIISSFNNVSKEQELLSILTKTEIKVLKYIINDFDNKNEGDVKVSQATEKYNISTSVFRTLFYKLKEYGVAAIDSRGVKGTHIKFNNIKNLLMLIDNY